MGPLIVDQYLSIAQEWTLEAIPHRGIPPQPRHMWKGLGPIPKDMRDSEDSLRKASLSVGSRKGVG